MTAKEYLSQIQTYRRAMNSLQEQADALRAQMAGLRAVTYDGDRVQTSPSNRMDELMPRLLEIEERYGRTLHDYHEAVLVRTRQIDEIGREDYAEVLRLRYIGTAERRLSLEEIAARMQRSFDWVRHLHGEALRAFQRKYLMTTHKNTSGCDIMASRKKGKGR